MEIYEMSHILNSGENELKVSQPINLTEII